MPYVQRVADRAVKVDVVKLLVSVLVSPLWVLGAIAAVGWVLVQFAFAAVLVGFGDVTKRAKPTGGD